MMPRQSALLVVTVPPHWAHNAWPSSTAQPTYSMPRSTLPSPLTSTHPSTLCSAIPTAPPWAVQALPIINSLTMAGCGRCMPMHWQTNCRAAMLNRHKLKLTRNLTVASVTRAVCKALAGIWGLMIHQVVVTHCCQWCCMKLCMAWGFYPCWRQTAAVVPGSMAVSSMTLTPSCYTTPLKVPGLRR